MSFSEKYRQFWEELGPGRVMVLATGGQSVTARSMSVVALDGRLFFQTDLASRKYAQLRREPRVALCADNLQLEGTAEELGHPLDHAAFRAAYEACFPGSFRRYSHLEGERLFAVQPAYIQRWLYIRDVPHVEVFDVSGESYSLREYRGR